MSHTSTKPWSVTAQVRFAILHEHVAFRSYLLSQPAQLSLVAYGRNALILVS